MNVLAVTAALRVTTGRPPISPCSLSFISQTDKDRFQLHRFGYRTNISLLQVHIASVQLTIIKSPTCHSIVPPSRGRSARPRACPPPPPTFSASPPSSPPPPPRSLGLHCFCTVTAMLRKKYERNIICSYFEGGSDRMKKEQSKMFV